MTPSMNYGSKAHNLLREMVRQRVLESQRKLSDRYSQWEDNEKLFQAYQPVDDEDARRKETRKTGKPVYTTITIPYSYATLLTAHTYWAAVFLSRSPIFQFTGRHGESQQKVQAMEALIDYQVRVGKMLVPLYIWAMDVGKYGMGIVGNYWDEETAVVVEDVEEPKTFMGVPLPGTSHTVRKRRVVRGYRGNKLFNVRPQDFLPDPRVSVANLQDGEYVGRIVQIPWNTILKRKAAGQLFNIEHLQRAYASWQQTQVEEGHSAIERPARFGDFTYTTGDETGDKHPAVVEAVEMVVELVPKHYNLGDSDYPEKWVVTLGFDEVVIGLTPLGADHNRFPYFVQLYEFDTYSHSSRSMLEVLQPLNNVLDWLFNSHMFNVRKALNDQFIYDPSRIQEKDVRDGGPGRAIKLRPAAYGTDIRAAFMQLQTMDVTRSNLSDIEAIMSFFARVSGVNDNQMGLPNPGGRKTATEIRSSTNMGINRLKTIAEFNSALGWDPLASVLIQNSQQEYDDEIVVRIVGDLVQSAPGFIPIRPGDIDGFYDFVPVDGTLPVDRFAQANMWKEILIGLAKFPVLAAQYDLGGIFGWMAQLAGLKNVTQFKIKPQVMPDQQLLAQAQAGNLKPVQGTGPTDIGVRQAADAAVGRNAA